MISSLVAFLEYCKLANAAVQLIKDGSLTLSSEVNADLSGPLHMFASSQTLVSGVSCH
jgi:hypothetical protein